MGGGTRKLYIFIVMSTDKPEDDLFSFETDHLALKGNKDYCEVLKTILILTAQREKALKDFKTVTERRNEALKDPFHTLSKIQAGAGLEVPPLQELPKLPVIDVQKYNVKVCEEDLRAIYSDTAHNSEEKLDVKAPNSNNRAWSSEEQKRLEELLQVYPPEPIEMRRFQKIAKALGNRTVHQVSSRVQKYFLKLYKAGLPIPGRIPKASEKHRKSALHKHQRNNHYLWKPTTFFPELCVPVQMDDANDVPGPSLSPPVASTSSCNNYLLRSDYQQNNDSGAPNRTSNGELQIELLRRIRQEKVKENCEDYLPYNHVGYRCDFCDEEPIVGSRWHCATCPDSIDFCTDCVLSQMYSENCHPLTHWLIVYADNSVQSRPSTSNGLGAKGFEDDAGSSGSSIKNMNEIDSNFESDLSNLSTNDSLNKPC